MEKENKRKALLLMIFGIVILIVVVAGATYAYFQNQLGNKAISNINIATNTTDILTFNMKDLDVTDDAKKIIDYHNPIENSDNTDIEINANQVNFTKDGNSIGDGIEVSANLVANDKTKEAEYKYNLYLDIKRNDLEYTTGTNTPELILVIKGPDGYIDNLSGLTTTQIEIKGEEEAVTGFDITKRTEMITITEEQLISASEGTDGKATDKWEVSVILKNLNSDQNKNTGKRFEAKLTMQTKKINTISFDPNASQYGSSDYKAKIKNVYFVDYRPSEEELQTKTNWDLSKKKDRSIIGWLEPSNDELVPYNLYIGSNEEIKVTSYSYAFDGLSKVETIDLNLDIINTNGLSSTSNMFNNCSSLSEIKGIEDLDVSNVTDMDSMFYNARSLTQLDLSNWDTSSVTKMSWMFSSSGITKLDLRGWDTHSVTGMNAMFYNARSLTNLDLSNWDTSSVTDMGAIFWKASSLTSVGDISGWDTSKVENMSDMFNGASSLTLVGDISGWDTSKVENMSDMFAYVDCSIIPDISNWDTSNVENMSSLFSRTTYNYDVSKIDTHNVTNMSEMFYNYLGTEILGIEKLDTSSVTYMSKMFQSAEALTELDLSNWDTHNVTNMSEMFRSASSLTTVGDISNWDTHSVTDISNMFTYVDSSIIPDISNWDTSNVKNMSGLFSGTTYNYDVSKIDTHNVTDMSNMFYIYKGTKILGIENLDISSVTNMSGMFKQNKLESLDLSNWDTSSVTDMSEMFRYANNLTTIDMSNATFRQLEKYTDMFSNTNSSLKVTINKDELDWFIDNNVLAREKINYIA